MNLNFFICSYRIEMKILYVSSHKFDQSVIFIKTLLSNRCIIFYTQYHHPLIVFKNCTKAAITPGIIEQVLFCLGHLIANCGDHFISTGIHLEFDFGVALHRFNVDTAANIIAGGRDVAFDLVLMGDISQRGSTHSTLYKQHHRNNILYNNSIGTIYSPDCQV